MKLTVTTLDGDMFSFEVSDDMHLVDFKAICELESGVATTQQDLFWNGNLLQDNNKSLFQYGLHDGEVLLLKSKITQNRPAVSHTSPQPSGVPMIDFGSMHMPGMSHGPSSSSQEARPSREDPNVIRELLLASPHDLSIVKERNPDLAEALLNGTKEKFVEVFRRQQNEKLQAERRRMEMFKKDQFDPEVQKMIAEEIRMKNVDLNMETAMEHSPESFGQVVMLYIDCKVNGHNVKAFVDSGAQMTIMSSECAERCHIKHLVDTRWAGVAHGVGTQKIIGRVHLGHIQIGAAHLPSSFSILEHQPMDMLLGLDMLRRHQCIIDLKNNKLIIGTTETETQFLPENEIPSASRIAPLPGGTSSTDDHNLAKAIAKSEEEAARGQSGFTHGTNISESSIQILTSHGFTRQMAIDQLRISNGNVDQALAALIAKSLAFQHS